MGEVPGVRRRRSGDRRTWPRPRGVDPARPRHAAPARRGPPGGRRARRPRRRTHAGSAPRNDAARAVTAARVPAVGGTRDVPAPDDVARDYLLLGLRLDQHLPGTVDGYFGPAELKARVDMEPLRPPARLAEDARRPPVAARRRGPGARSPPLARPPAGRGSRRWPGCRAGESIPYLDQVERCLALRPERRDGRDRSSEPPRRSTRCLPGHGSLAERLEGGGRRLDGAARSGPGRRRGARRAIPGSRGVAVRAARGRGAARLAGPGPALVRLQLVRRRLPLARRHQPRPPDPPPEPRRHRGPRDLPRPPPRARREGAAAGRGARPTSSPRSC